MRRSRFGRYITPSAKTVGVATDTRVRSACLLCPKFGLKLGKVTPVYLYKKSPDSFCLRAVCLPRARGAQVAYIRYGSGPSIVLVSASREWRGRSTATGTVPYNGLFPFMKRLHKHHCVADIPHYSTGAIEGPLCVLGISNLRKNVVKFEVITMWIVFCVLSQRIKPNAVVSWDQTKSETKSPRLACYWDRMELGKTLVRATSASKNALPAEFVLC